MLRILESTESREEFPLFRLHPELVLELSRVITVLLEQVKNPAMGLREKDIRKMMRPIVAQIRTDEPIDYRENTFMGYIDELRVASYHARQGYEVVRLNYEFVVAPQVPDGKPQPQGEIDIILEDPKTKELILVEVKSHLRSSDLTKQLDRYTQFLKKKRKIIYDHRHKVFRSFDKVFVYSSATPAKTRRQKYSKTHTWIEFHTFPKAYKRRTVFPGVYSMSEYPLLY